MQTHTVSEITGYIHELFDADEILADIWVRGEVSNLTKARSGHWYFTIKDADAQLRCVMPASASAITTRAASTSSMPMRSRRWAASATCTCSLKR